MGIEYGAASSAGHIEWAQPMTCLAQCFQLCQAHQGGDVFCMALPGQIICLRPVQLQACIALCCDSARHTQFTCALSSLAADGAHCSQAQGTMQPDAPSTFLVRHVLAAGGGGSHCPEAKAGGSKAAHCQGEGLGVCQDPAAA